MKEQIINKALELFISKGYKSVSLIEIAKSLEITKGGIYHYFSSKEDLLVAVNELILNQFSDSFHGLDVNECTFKDLINYIINSIMPAVSIEGYYEFLISSYKITPELRDKVKVKYMEIISSFEHIIQRDIKKGLISSENDPSLLAIEVSALLEGLLLLKEMYSLDDFAKRSTLILNNFYHKISK